MGNQGESAARARLGAWTLDVARRQVTRDGAAAHLTPKAFDLLVLLAREAPRVVPKAELHERLWPGTFVSDATLVGLVKELRRALDDRDPQAPIIRTVHRVGYACAAAPVPAARAGPDAVHWLVVGGRRVPIERGETLIGRDPASAVHLDAPGVSRRHARVVLSDAGALLEDLGSKNGTRLGDRALAGPAALQDGDRIRVGAAVILYRTSRSGMSTETQAQTTADIRQPRHEEDR